jgi:hypothetical protein
MSYAERSLRKARRGMTPAQLWRNRCRVCMAHIPACKGNARCAHRRQGLCIEHMRSANNGTYDK